MIRIIFFIPIAVRIFQPGLAPVPIHHCAVDLGIYRDVTGLAGYFIVVEIKYFVVVRTAGMTVLAADAVIVAGRNRVRAAFDIVSFGYMTVNTGHVRPVNPHVNIHLACRIVEGFLKISMFNIVAATAIKMAHAAIAPVRVSYVLSHIVVVGYFKLFIGSSRCCRPAGHAFLLEVGIGLVMANQTVDVVWVIKVEVVIFPSVTNMAAHAGSVVAERACAEIVIDVFFANFNQSLAGQLNLAFPKPVRADHQLVVALVMTC